MNGDTFNTRSLEPVHAMIGIVVLFSISAVASYFGVQVRVMDGALLGVIWVLIEILKSGKRRDTKLQDVDTKLTNVATTMATVQKQTNHNLEDLTCKLDKALGENTELRLDKRGSEATAAAALQQAKEQT